LQGGLRTPCDSELHYVYSQISEEWLDKALEHLDAKVTALYAKFNEFPRDSLVERERVMKKRLAKETEDIIILNHYEYGSSGNIAQQTSALSAFLEPDLRRPGIRCEDAEERKLDSKAKGCGCQKCAKDVVHGKIRWE